MRRIAIINQKGGVGKTTTSANLGAALAEQGRRVALVDMDPQANLTLHLGLEVPSQEPTIYTVLLGRTTIAQALRPTTTPGLSLVASNIDLSGAEMELAGAIGRENLVGDAVAAWEGEHRRRAGGAPADYLLFDCPPSLGLLSVNALAACDEVVITVQTEFLALMGMSKLVEVVQLIRRRLNPALKISGIVPCLYDSRLRLAREVLGEIRKYFPGQVFRQAVRMNVKLAEAPSFGRTILEYAPDSNGALDYRRLALELIAQESLDPELAGLSAPRAVDELCTLRPAPAGVQAAGNDPAEGDEGRNEAGERADGESALEALREVVITPPAPPARVPPGQSAGTPAARPSPRASSAVDDELRVLRAEDLPPLSAEAFGLPRRPPLRSG